MKTITAFSQHKNILWTVGFMVVFLIGVVTSIIFTDGLALSLTVISISLTVIFILKPTWLFYSFMLLFVFSEINVGHFFIQPSLSSGFALLALTIIFLYSLSGKPIYRLFQSPIKRNLVLGLAALFMVEFLSAFLNDSFRPLTTRLAALVSLLFILMVVREKSTVWRGYYLGIISVGMLGLFTVLAGLDLNPFGFRATANWRSTPWEAYIPRAIGLPNMQGGLHGIFILAFLPLAILLTANGKKLKLNLWMRSLTVSTVILGVLALLIASYRSGWLGLLVSLSCLVLFHFRFSHATKIKKILQIIFLINILILILLPFGKSIYSDFYNLAFNVRAQGVDARFIQSEYVLGRMLSPSIHLIFGYGYDDFGLSFMRYAAQQGYNNPELYPWIHNYYLSLFYASGLVGVVQFLAFILYILKTLYQQAESPEYPLRLVNSALFSSLAGILVVLLFTAEISGLQIMWILIATSALMNERK